MSKNKKKKHFKI